jgi:hypothetical protein
MSGPRRPGQTIGPDPPACSGRLAKAQLDELWSNARTAGYQSIAVNACEGDGTRGAARIWIRAHRDERYVNIRVEDDRPGFPDTMLREPQAHTGTSTREGSALVSFSSRVSSPPAMATWPSVSGLQAAPASISHCLARRADASARLDDGGHQASRQANICAPDLQNARIEPADLIDPLLGWRERRRPEERTERAAT